MNNVFVYCEIEGTTVAEVSQELLTKGRKLANQLGVELDAVVAGTGIKGKVEDQILPYGVDKLFVFDAMQDHAGYPEPERLSAWTAGRREKQSSAGKSMQPHKV